MATQRKKPKGVEAMLTSSQVAELCGVDPRTLKKWRAAGKLKGHRLGYRTVRYRREEVERFLAGR